MLVKQRQMPTVGEEMPFGVRNMIDNRFRNKRRAEVISPIGHQNRNVNVFELIRLHRNR